MHTSTTASPSTAGKDGFSDGVTVFFDTSTGNRIQRNSIFSNVGLGIDLNADGITANDPGDADTGPNNLQNKPTITSATTSGGTTTVEGRLNSTPGRTFTIQFFSNFAGNEGKTFKGQTTVTTNANGVATFSVPLGGAVPVGNTITVTATRADNTSEFSAPEQVTAQ